MSTPVLYTFDADKGVATLALNRPEVLNAIDVPTARAFGQAVNRAAAEKGLRCVLIKGAGKAFAAGGDVGAFAENLDDARGLIDDLLDNLNPALVTLRAIDAPVVAAVRGPAAGAGFSIVLGADYVIASDNAVFQVAYGGIGGQPDCGGTAFLERRVGRLKAFELMLMNKRLDAAAALAYGVVTEAVADADLDARVAQVIETIAAGPTAAFGRFKRLMEQAPSTPLAAQLEAERKAFLDAVLHAEFREGVTAFTQRRKPDFRNA